MAAVMANYLTLNSLPTNPKPPDPDSKALLNDGKLSFVAAASRPKLQERHAPIPLPARQYGVMEGRPSIPFTLAEFHAGADPYSHTLIAKFFVGRHTLEVIRNTLKDAWTIKGRATLSSIWDARHVMIVLDSEEDVVSSLTCPDRKVQHAGFRLFRYTPDYNPKKESTITTKWIRLPNLPPPLYHKSFIAAIINSFADFLDTDAFTKACINMRYARACIEYDVSLPLTEFVWIALPDDKGFWQPIELEGNISYCSHCKIHGHILSQCRKKKVS